MTDEKQPEQSSNQQNPTQKDQPAHGQDQKQGQGSPRPDQQGRKPGQTDQDVDTEKKKTA